MMLAVNVAAALLPLTALASNDCADQRFGVHDNCREQHNADGRLIWRGLRVRVGMSYGFVNNKKPLNTGRADYFGVLPNGAARVSALAAPGQVRSSISTDCALVRVLPFFTEQKDFGSASANRWQVGDASIAKLYCQNMHVCIGCVMQRGMLVG
jgi:hypothetical protein